MPRRRPPKRELSPLQKLLKTKKPVTVRDIVLTDDEMVKLHGFMCSLELTWSDAVAEELTYIKRLMYLNRIMAER